MIHLAKDKTKLMIAVHGWSGILLGLLLYAVVLTGTAAVFAEEIGAWSAGHVRHESALTRPIDRSVRDLAARTPAAFREGVNLFEIGDHRLGAWFHRDEAGPGGATSQAMKRSASADCTCGCRAGFTAMTPYWLNSRWSPSTSTRRACRLRKASQVPRSASR